MVNTIKFFAVRFCVILVLNIQFTQISNGSNVLVNLDYNNSNLQKIIWDYLISKDKQKYDHPLQSSNIGIFKFDIDDDGIEEIFIYVNHVGYCGSHGCIFMILKPKSKDLKTFAELDEIKFFSEENSGGIINYKHMLILASKTKGFHDLMFCANDYEARIGTPFVYTFYTWQGKYYDIVKRYPASEY